VRDVVFLFFFCWCLSELLVAVIHEKSLKLLSPLPKLVSEKVLHYHQESQPYLCPENSKAALSRRRLRVSLQPNAVLMENDCVIFLLWMPNAVSEQPCSSLAHFTGLLILAVISPQQFLSVSFSSNPILWEEYWLVSWLSCIAILFYILTSDLVLPPVKIALPKVCLKNGLFVLVW